MGGVEFKGAMQRMTQGIYVFCKRRWLQSNPLWNPPWTLTSGNRPKLESGGESCQTNITTNAKAKAKLCSVRLLVARDIILFVLMI